MARGIQISVLAAALLASSSACATARATCPQSPAVILVDTRANRLLLCEKGAATKEFAVALGRGGVGKTRQGDRRTPLGTYPLGEPRPSKRFGIFIPIGYPTAKQAKQGFTGSAVGIHGPDRKYSWLGAANTWVDWTQGCIAVATDAAIEEIAKWVEAKKPTVHIQ